MERNHDEYRSGVRSKLRGAKSEARGKEVSIFFKSERKIERNNRYSIRFYSISIMVMKEVVKKKEEEVEEKMEGGILVRRYKGSKVEVEGRREV
jgi:hypothetical protein